MIIPRLSFVIIALLSFSESYGQYFSNFTQVSSIDSLINRNMLAEAEKKATFLLRNMPKTYNKREQLHLELDIERALARKELESNNERQALEILFPVIEKSTKKKFYETAIQAHLLAALIYEMAEDSSNCRNHLTLAMALCRDFKLASQYSSICIRYSSFHRFFGTVDSISFFANEAIKFGKQYNKNMDIADGYFSAYNPNARLFISRCNP